MASVVEKAKTFVASVRKDGWANVITGLGTSRDKQTYARVFQDPKLSDQELAALGRTDDLARKIISALVDEAMRQGWNLQGDDDSDDSTDLRKECDRFQVRARVHQAAVWGRWWGGACVFIGVDGDQSEPLDEEKLQAGAVRFLRVHDRRRLRPVEWYTDPLEDKFGLPSHYAVSMLATGAGVEALTPRVHETRLVMFPGADTDEETRRFNQGWDDSVLQTVYNQLRAANSNWDGLCHLMTDIGQGVVKLSGLMDMVAAGREDLVRDRMTIMDMGRSVVRSLILDAKEEDFERKASPVAGLEGIMWITWQRVAAAAGMPVTKLMGMSPAGLNATGDADIRNWYDSVRHEQDTVLTPRLERLVRILARNIGDATPEQWRVQWPSLWQLSPLEDAQRRESVAKTDTLYIDYGVLLAEEVTLARADGDTAFPAIDLDVRRAALKAELVKLEDEAGKPEPTPPEPPTPGTPPPGLPGKPKQPELPGMPAPPIPPKPSAEEEPPTPPKQAA